MTTYRILYHYSALCKNQAPGFHLCTVYHMITTINIFERVHCVVLQTIENIAYLKTNQHQNIIEYHSLTCDNPSH